MVDSAPTNGRVIVFGIIFWYPLAGVTYQCLHYLLGLKQLGYDVYYVEDMQGDVYDPVAGDYTYDPTENVRRLGPHLNAHGFEGRWAFRDCNGATFGMTDAALNDLYKSADVCLNVCASHSLRDDQLIIPNRLYVESDPFSAQVKYVEDREGARHFLDAHTAFFTFGENIGQPDCGIPITGHKWFATRQPVHLPLWADSPITGGGTYTTITTWHNRGEPLYYNGQPFYWTKDREFSKYLELPKLRPGVKIELATTTDPEVTGLLHGHGWRTTDSLPVSVDPAAYRNYIFSSRGEFTVARDQYARPRTGWSSDRSVCYLAAGRPVVTGDTGFGRALPVGRGLFAFNNIDDILAAVDAIETDYEGNCRAAREIAAEYFSADKVLRRLMADAGVG